MFIYTEGICAPKNTSKWSPTCSWRVTTLHVFGVSPLSPGAKWYVVFFFKACDWGILHEPRAKQECTERTGAIIQERGVFLSDSSLLGGSPDGTVSDDCIIEVKCPWSARTKTVLQAAESRDFFLVLDEVTGSLSLKRTHN